MKAWRPSRRNEITYSRTCVMYLVPLAVLFVALFLGSATYFALGFLHADGEALVLDALASAASLLLALIALRNARAALRDRRIQRQQLRGWRRRLTN